MHLSPEQIDRQPFRMRRRGYDVVQVRNFLRDIAAEMRARDEVRERLANGGDPDEVMGRDARAIVERAEAEAAQIVAAAEERASDIPVAAEQGATEIIEAARVEAAAVVEESEQAARDRSSAVLAETQSRLDQLLAAEREVHKRLADAEQREQRVDAEVEPVDQPSPEPALVDGSFADFVKDTLRNEIRPE